MIGLFSARPSRAALRCVGTITLEVGLGFQTIAFREVLRWSGVRHLRYPTAASS
jgi:hypothetical protein